MYCHLDSKLTQCLNRLFPTEENLHKVAKQGQAGHQRSPAPRTFSSWSTTSCASTSPEKAARLQFLQQPLVMTRCTRQCLFVQLLFVCPRRRGNTQ